jgi:Domain of unknown function (DUF4157)/Novel toxin 16
LERSTTTRQMPDTASAQRSHPTTQFSPFASNPWFSLQQAIGNRAMGGLLGALQLRHNEKSAGYERRIPLQTKLAIGDVNDPLESEADTVAEQVMRDTARPRHADARVVLRKCSCENSGAPCNHCKEEQEGELHRKSASAVNPVEAPPEVHEVLRSPGQPLDSAAREFMESRFGRDFSDVRVHTDARAQRSASSISALAYAADRHLVFANGQYAPHSAQGSSLLAHELTHVIQQGGGRSSARSPGISPSGPKVQRQQGEVGVHASQTPAAPYEKSSTSVEAMYRRAGLIYAANAVKRCREGDCLHVLTEAEAYEAYRSGRLTSGMGEPEHGKTGPSAPQAAAPLAVGAMTAPALSQGARSLTTTAAKTAAERAAALGWGEATEGVVLLEGGGEAAAAAPAAAAGTVAIPVALGVYVIVATIDLIGYASFQSALQKQGFVILPNALGVCIGSCHQPAAPTYNPTDFIYPPTSLIPSMPDMDIDTISKWLDQTPTEASRKRRAPTPAPTPAPVPAPRPTAPPKSNRCTDQEVDRLHEAMKKLCDKVRGCNMQNDTCATATAKVAAYNACLTARINLQKKCFQKGDPGYEGHMQQIAQLYAGLRECEQVMMAKC